MRMIDMCVIGIDEQTAGTLLCRTDLRAHQSEQFAADAVRVAAKIDGRRRAGGPLGIGHVGMHRAGFGVDADKIAFAQFGDGAAAGGLRRDVDRREHFARCAGHAAVGDEGDLEALVLKHGQGGRQAVQFRHAVGARPLEAQDNDHVPVQPAILEGLKRVFLGLEDGGGGLDTASYSNATTGLIASLTNAGSNTGEALGDTYVSIENLTGSAFDDVLIGERRVPNDRLLTWLLARLDPKNFALPWEQRGDTDPQAAAVAAFPGLLDDLTDAIN